MLNRLRYSNTSCSVQKLIGCDVGLFLPKALHPYIIQLDARCPLSAAIVAMIALLPVLFSNCFAGDFFMASQHLSEILNGVAINETHCLEIFHQPPSLLVLPNPPVLSSTPYSSTFSLSYSGRVEYGTIIPCTKPSLKWKVTDSW